MPDIRQTANDRKTITAATFRRFSARAHYGMCGLPFAKCYWRRSARLCWRECRRTNNLLAMPVADQGSGILSSMANADCFIVLPEESEGAEKGDKVQVQLFEGMV